MGENFVFFIFLTFFFSIGESVSDYNTLLEAQFLNVTEEIKSSDLILQQPKIHEADQKDWYEVGLDFEVDKIKREWTNIHSATELDIESIQDVENNVKIDNLEHKFMEVNLSFPFPFYGGVVRKFVVTTAGALLTGDPEVQLRLPSYIAPFLTNINPNERDAARFFDKGSYFLAHWEKHIDGDDRHMIKFRVKLYPSGIIRFMYRNIVQGNIDEVKKTGYPSIIGLQDGFTSSNGSDIYLYPSTQIDLEKLLDKDWAMITFTPKEGGCASRSDETCSNDCVPCQEMDCVYNMELHRPASACYNFDQQKPIDYCTVSCPETTSPVCGSNNQTYVNRCVLLKDNCMYKKNVSIVANTGCRVVDMDYSEIKAHNETDYDYEEMEQPEIQPGQVVGINDCDQNKGCPDTKEYVCASNNKTYPNECSMRQVNCDQKLNLTILKQGKCIEFDEAKKELKETDSCQKVCTKDNNPVCGSDGKTYPNSCTLEVASCTSKNSITKVNDGVCKNETPKEIPNCMKICTRELSPVCGSDGKTYSNPCVFDQERCKSNNTISLANKGACNIQTSNDTDKPLIIPNNAIMSEKEQSADEKRINETEDEEDSNSGNTTKAMGVTGLIIFFCLVVLTVLYRRRKNQFSRRPLESSRAPSTDSWLYPQSNEYRDEEDPIPAPSSFPSIPSEISTSTTWELHRKTVKNDKLPLVPNMEEEIRRDGI